VSSSHVEIDPGGSECSHALTLSLSENENRRRWMASVDAPLILSVSHTSKNIERCRLGSSIGEPPNCDCWTMEINVGLSSKLWAATGGIVMPGFDYGHPGGHNLGVSSFALHLLPLKIHIRLVGLFVFLIYKNFSLFRDQTRMKGSFA